MECIVCQKDFENGEDEDICPTCKNVVKSKKSREAFRKWRRFGKNNSGGKNETNQSK